MAKHVAAKFDRLLHKLFNDRTHWLKAQVRKPNPGKPPTFDKNKVEKAIRHLQSLAEEAQLHARAIRDVENLYAEKKQWHVTTNKGWGIDRKRQAFNEWFDEHVPHDNCVYVFWAGRRCRYVGRTLGGKNRPQSQFQKHWFQGVTRVDIYSSRAAREIPKLECLLTHRFDPKHSKVTPASRKWLSKCPICETRSFIRDEIKYIFRLR